MDATQSRNVIGAGERTFSLNNTHLPSGRYRTQLSNRTMTHPGRQ